MKWLDFIGAIASIVGLCVAIWTLMVARAARQAAQDAREAVRLGDAVEEFATLNRLASEFLGFVENGQSESASLRARDLLSGILTAKERWRRFIPIERVAELEQVTLQVGVISRTLVSNEQTPTPVQRQRLLRFSQEVVSVIAEVAGTMTLQSELRGQ